MAVRLVDVIFTLQISKSAKFNSQLFRAKNKNLILQNNIVVSAAYTLHLKWSLDTRILKDLKDEYAHLSVTTVNQ